MKQSKFIKIVLGIAIAIGVILIIGQRLYAATQIFPSQIKSGTNGYVLTTVGSTTTWAAATGGGSATTTINGTDGPTFTFTLGTTGTDAGIASSSGTITFNFPNSSASNRGLLTSADWTTFNNKVSSQWTTTSTGIFYNGGRVGLGVSSPGYTLDVNGTANVSGTSTLAVTTATNLGIIGTAGNGFLTLVGQSSNPTAPAAGTLLLHSSTINGFTRLEQDNESATNLILGRDNAQIAYNNSGGTLNKGTVVYISGTNAGSPEISAATANSATTLPAIGVVMDNIANGSFGQVMTKGIMTGLNTNAFSANDSVYVSTSAAGGLQNTRPSGTSAAFVQRVGKVLVQSATVGIVDFNFSLPVLNAETGTTAATFTGNAITGTTITASTGVDVGNTDTSITRTGAGTIAVEGIPVVIANSTTVGQVPTITGSNTYSWQTPTASGSFWTAVAGSPARLSSTTISLSGDYTSLFAKGIVLKWTESSTVRNAMVSIPSTFSTPTTTVTFIGDQMASIDANSLKYATIGVIPFATKFSVAGTIGATGTDIANSFYSTQPKRVLGADLQVGTAGTTNNTTVDINKNGTTMFTTKPTLATTIAASPLPFTADTATSLSLNDKVTIDIDAVQTTPAVDLYVQLYLWPTLYNNL